MRGATRPIGRLPITTRRSRSIRGIRARWANRGDFYQQQGEFDRAVEDYDRAIMANPEDFEAYNQRGTVRLIMGEPERAIPDYDKAIAVNPKFVSRLRQSRRGLPRAGRFRPRHRRLQSGAHDRSEIRHGLDNRGITYVEKGEYARGIADFDAALKIDPMMTIVYTHRAMAHASNGARDRALADFDQAIKIDPSDPYIYLGRGNMFLEQGQLDRAISDYDSAIMAERNFADAFANRGVAYARKGDFNRAVVDFDRAIMLDPSLPDLFANRGLSYVKTGQYARAIADLDKALDGQSPRRLEPLQSRCCKAASRRPAGRGRRRRAGAVDGPQYRQIRRNSPRAMGALSD